MEIICEYVRRNERKKLAVLINQMVSQIEWQKEVIEQWELRFRTLLCLYQRKTRAYNVLEPEVESTLKRIDLLQLMWTEKLKVPNGWVLTQEEDTKIRSWRILNRSETPKEREDTGLLSGLR